MKLKKCTACGSKRMIMPIPKKGELKTTVWCYYCGVEIDIEIEINELREDAKLNIENKRDLSKIDTEFISWS